MRESKACSETKLFCLRYQELIGLVCIFMRKMKLLFALADAVDSLSHS